MNVVKAENPASNSLGNIAVELLATRQEFQALRRDLHSHPELGYEEHRTAKIITDKLSELGIPFECGIAGTGIVAAIRKGTKSRAIGLRADIDALPIQEANKFMHASTVPGKMHACGHDGHTAMLLAAAKHCHENLDFDGTVYLIFQPAEEYGTGAGRMISEGIFKSNEMEAVFGLHNWPGLPTGTFAVNHAAMMASSNNFKITVKGRGSHAGLPHNSIDPVVGIVALVQSLQTILTRNLSPLDVAVLSVTQIHTGDTSNVIPDEGWVGGVVRTLDLDVLDLVERRMWEVSQSIAETFGCRADLNFERICPPTVNNPAATDMALRAMVKTVGQDRVIPNIEPSMASEDFSAMLRQKPGCYAFIGAGDGSHRERQHGAGSSTLHSSSFDFNDELIPVGAQYWCNLVKTYLGQPDGP